MNCTNKYGIFAVTVSHQQLYHRSNKNISGISQHSSSDHKASQVKAKIMLHCILCFYSVVNVTL